MIIELLHHGPHTRVKLASCLHLYSRQADHSLVFSISLLYCVVVTMLRYLAYTHKYSVGIVGPKY